MNGGEICGICNEVEETPLAFCIECGTKFHLNPRKDRPGKDCGDVVLGQSMGVEMICNNCIDLRRAGDDPGANSMGMFAALTGDALPLPPGQRMPPAQRAEPRPTTPAAQPPKPAPQALKPTDERPRRRFRRIDG